MRLEFHKIRRLPPYVFEQVNVTKAGLRAEGADVIDLGMGNPDLPTPPHIVEKLCETARRPDVHGYSASRGIMGLRRALSAYYDRRFGVKLDPNKEVVVTLGSKEGFANLAQAIAAPGDTILVPNPSYPLHSFGFIMAGATIRSRAGAFAGGISLQPRPRGQAHRAAADRHGRLLSGQPDRAGRRTRFLQGGHQVREEARDLRALRSCLHRNLFRRSRRPRSCRSTARRTSPSKSPRCRRPTPWPAGASASPPATNA